MDIDAASVQGNVGSRFTQHDLDSSRTGTEAEIEEHLLNTLTEGVSKV
ncbi:MAG: hypothetical protein GY858_08740 [Candidatus Omnitrophica bacterium]|nr:hypothetical protein [Candidatus Omnitrophota bacterium]